MKNYKIEKICVSIFLIFLIIFSSLSYDLTYFTTNGISANQDYNRAIVGPKNLLNNSDFSKVSSWERINATDGPQQIIVVDYDNLSSPSYMRFYNGGHISETPFTYSAYLKQNFTKSIWTPNYPTAVTCTFDYNMTLYIGMLDGSNVIDLEFWLELRNLSSPSTISRWPIAAGNTGSHPKFITADGLTGGQRLGSIQQITKNVGANQGSFSIVPPGLYEFAINVSLSCAMTGKSIICGFILRFDNITLNINDISEPLIVANNLTFGPYNSDPVGLIDVDFFAGLLENTSLTEGKFRLNNSDIPGPWYTIFRNKNSYLQNWSITPIWDDLVDGNNIIDLFCIDDVGNYNDSVKITVEKDTIPPSSYAYGLPGKFDSRTFNISYNVIDESNKIEHVELWYLLQNKWHKWFGLDGKSGNFTTSPITFVADCDGTFGFKTVAYDKAGNIEAGGVPSPNNKPPTIPDVIITIDTLPPSPIFLLPNKNHINGIETITVASDYDTQQLELFYWIDSDRDGIADHEDVGSSWKQIGLLSEPTEDNKWSIIWNTTNFNLFPEFRDEELLVILKAVGTDDLNKKGEGFRFNLEVDNIPPKVTIINPEENTSENEAIMVLSYEIDHPDGNVTRFFWSYYDKDTWKLIDGTGLTNGLYLHPFGEKMGNYSWIMSEKLIGESPTIKIKVEVIDDAGNIGIGEVGPIYINLLEPMILDNFPTNITLDEDFGEYIKVYTYFESHGNPTFSGDNLNWYVTGNSGRIFQITGGNNSNDSFTYTSIINKYGVETLTFHLWDPLFIEHTKVQTVIINSINDPPTFENLPPKFYIAYDSGTTIDFSIYVNDVDNEISELIIATNDLEHVTANGLNLTFNYPASMEGKPKFVKLILSDGSNITEETIRVIISVNHPPKWNGKIEELVLYTNMDEPKYLNFNDYFSDPDGDKLTYTYASNLVDIEVIENNKVKFTAKPNAEGFEKLWFRAWDPEGAFADGYMLITILNIPQPPIIKNIPDMNIRYDSENGYMYDFSYFIYDPDNNRSELTIRVLTLDKGDNDSWIENDRYNNMRIIFKFPFEAAEKRHKLALYVTDPDNQQTYRIFNVTVIIGNWPVEQIKSIPAQEFLEDESKNNAFKLEVNTEGAYFKDIDGGTNFEILEHEYINAVIDEENYVDLSSKVLNWNTGDGFTELVILAKDSYPDQFVYAVVRVYVLPVNDRPVLKPLGQVNVTKGEPIVFNLKDFIIDVDTELSDLSIITGSKENLEIDISGTLLIIKSEKIGTHVLEVWIQDFDGSISNIEELKIKVPDDSKQSDYYTDITMYGSIIGFVIILIFIFLFLLIFLKKKAVLIPNGKREERFLSEIEVTHVKRKNEQKLTEIPWNSFDKRR